MVAPIPGAEVTCQFGVPGGWAAGYHTGRDYRARTPVPVHASAAGKVLHADWGGWGAAYGIQVIIETDGVRHLYAHLSSVTCRPGQSVAAGEQVGVSGATGTRVFGAHLHYEERVSPYGYSHHRKPVFDLRPGDVSKPSKPMKVDIGEVVEAFQLDPDRPQGSGVHPRHVRPVEKALLAEGLLDSAWAMDGYAGTSTREAYRKWQQRLGFTGKDADGFPGKTSLTELGRRYGFVVQGKVREVPSARSRPQTSDALGPAWCPFAERDLIAGNSETGAWNSGAEHWKGLLHTTEGSSYAGARAAYADGGVPHFTIAPDFARRKVQVFQHFPLTSRATALRDPDQTPLKENRAHVLQVEIVGTCDERNRGKFPDGLFVGDWPQWYLRGIRKLMRWMELSRPIAHASTVEWKAYDSGKATGSFGEKNGVRLTAKQYVEYSGWLGHQHAPGNSHGDPGMVDIDFLLKEERPVLTPTTKKAAKKAIARVPVGL